MTVLYLMIKSSNGHKTKFKIISTSLKYSCQIKFYFYLGDFYLLRNAKFSRENLIPAMNIILTNKMLKIRNENIFTANKFFEVLKFGSLQLSTTSSSRFSQFQVRKFDQIDIVFLF